MTDATRHQGRPLLAVYTSWSDPAPWLRALEAAMPDFAVAWWPDLPAHRPVTAAAVWHAPLDLFRASPDLRVVQSLGAGVDHLWALGPDLPDLPILRLVDPVMTERLAHYVLAGTLLFQRRFDRYAQQQREGRWQRHPHPDPGEVTVGLLGLGVMGQATAALLGRVGFRVEGWSRTPRTLPGVTCHHGPEGLSALAAGADALACLLPLTQETKGLLDRRLFAAMRPGSHLIHAGRGDHLVAADLIDALDQGQLAGALLDVFKDEPLPADDPLWHHPKVIVTPHTAAISNPTTAAVAIAEGIRAVLRGEQPPNLALRGRAY